MVRGLFAHIRHFVRTRLESSFTGSLEACVSNMLSGNAIGVLHLNRRGRILGANDFALEILWCGDGLFEERGCLHARWQTDKT